MLKYTLKRLLELIPKLLIISLVIFFALQLLPGDPITRSVSPDVYKNMSAEQLEALRESLGFLCSISRGSEIFFAAISAIHR